MEEGNQAGGTVEEEKDNAEVNRRGGGGSCGGGALSCLFVQGHWRPGESRQEKQDWPDETPLSSFQGQAQPQTLSARAAGLGAP